MAGRILTKSILDSIRVPVGFQAAAFHGRSRIGNREIVGHGMNGQANYQDRIDYPMPSIRFREDTADIKVLSPLYDENIYSIDSLICGRLNFRFCARRKRATGEN